MAEPSPHDVALMRRAISNAAVARTRATPNPWVGAVIELADGTLVDGATEAPGGRHAEIVALDAAGPAAQGATLYSTLEPCVHTGRTGPCVDAIVDAGVGRVVFGVDDPDLNVSGRARGHLEAAGIDVGDGVCADEVDEQLAPYLVHRRTGRPYVLLKLAATLDGRLAAPDGTSRWITGPEARVDVHRLRAESDAILVGAGTVRADDPSLTVRDADGDDPMRVVLGAAPEVAKVRPCREMSGELGGVLDELGADGVVQLMVEGGGSVAGDFHRAGLVDRYVVYLAPRFAGGDDGVAMFTGPGVRTMSDVWSGRFASVTRLGDDVRLDVVPRSEAV